MRQSVIGNLMTARKNFLEQLREFFRAHPDDEESRARAATIEHIQDFFGMLRRRAIINRDPNFLLRSLKRAQHRSPPLRVWNKSWIKQKEMRNEQWNECDHQIDLKENDRPDQRDHRER